MTFKVKKSKYAFDPMNIGESREFELHTCVRDLWSAGLSVYNKKHYGYKIKITYISADYIMSYGKITRLS